MEYIYASLLLHSARREINEENLRKVLEAAGIAADEVRVKMVVAALKEVNIDEVLKTATATPIVPAPAVAPATQPQPAAEEAKEERKEEKKEVSEEDLAAGLSSLFG